MTRAAIVAALAALACHPSRADGGVVAIIPAATTLQPGQSQVVCSVVRYKDGTAKLGQDAYRFRARADRTLESALVRDVRAACAPVLAPLGLDARTMEIVDTNLRRAATSRGVLT